LFKNFIAGTQSFAQMFLSASQRPGGEKSSESLSSTKSNHYFLLNFVEKQG